MKITFVLPKGFCKVGSTYDFPKEEAEKLIQRGIAEPASKEKPKKESSKDKPKEDKPKFFGGDK